jgi:hypothetical protein
MHTYLVYVVGLNFGLLCNTLKSAPFEIELKRFNFVFFAHENIGK